MGKTLWKIEKMVTKIKGIKQFSLFLMVFSKGILHGCYHKGLFGKETNSKGIDKKIDITKNLKNNRRYTDFFQ